MGSFKAIACALCVIGCGAPAEHEYVQSWREQFPQLAVPGCMTVWSVNDECSVSGADGVPRQCVADADPMIVRTDPSDVCLLAFNRACDCANQEIETQ